ncbi:sigma-54-dependent transcriptional regulator [Atopomonas sediminilitoris]|uniref:sigma-54-dependent transcriptional regulator n=1 Tax=Atopomonas sediminilitoris TaxID=2919919 RepID=UPI001F4D93F1|nr:sigma-54-dependent transcriptional regulator [Atopomonas sediminilitoris]MCJ8168441.1 sigma-54-dependent transcriptional regulator [Atopomonas sediminilitoris]
MRIHVTFDDRVGITQEVLALLGGRNLNLDAVEMVPPNVYIDAPTLLPEVLAELRQALLAIAGVQTVAVIDLLPSQHRRLQLNALLDAMTDPAVLLDSNTHVMLANVAFLRCLPEASRHLAGTVGELFNDPALTRELQAHGFRLPMREVLLAGQAFLLDAVPLASDDSGQAGALLTLFHPSRIGGRLSALQEQADDFATLLGNSPPMRTLLARAQRLAQLDAPLLIQGETGTGKELIARASHSGGGRASEPFLALNCAAVPENLAESELFGYVSGAFTGAQRGGKPGLLELADKGTVFLDEIGEMSLYLQAKLLRFLNDGRFRRVGGEREIQVDVRIVSATHRDLKAMVAAGSFREDLYYRLNVLNLEVPPLRERGQDILALAEAFLQQACKQIRRQPCRLTAATHDTLLNHAWPGNVRQLQNVIFRAAAIGEGPLIDQADLDIPAATATSLNPNHEHATLEASMARYERDLLSQLYQDFPSTRRLAERLGTSHTAIAKRLRKYGIGNE